MKYIKTINELFDTEELKSSMDLDYLSGNIPFKELIKDKNLLKQKDLLLSKLIMNCSFIMKLGYKRINKNLLTIGFDNSKNFKKDGVFLYFVIEIMSNSDGDKFICNIYAKCIDNNLILYSEKVSTNGNMVDYDKLYNMINKEALDILIDFNQFTENNYDLKYFPFTNRIDAIEPDWLIGNN